MTTTTSGDKMEKMFYCEQCDLALTDAEAENHRPPRELAPRKENTMSKSKYPKWVNPTGDSDWDNYFEVVWPMVIPSFVISVLLIGIIIGRVL